MRMFSVVTLILCVVIAGCSQETKQAGQAQSAAQASAISASVKVVPGSYEDWCEEHQVPESACTHCDAALIPAFKATKDWCQEHGLPESQCRACNPELKIARPPKLEGK